MGAGMWFWIIYILCLIFGLFLSWPANASDKSAWRPFGSNLIVLILLGLLGWGVFGPPIK